LVTVTSKATWVAKKPGRMATSGRSDAKSTTYPLLGSGISSVEPVDESISCRASW
jgi:hypothetical protein